MSNPVTGCDQPLATPLRRQLRHLLGLRVALADVARVDFASALHGIALSVRPERPRHTDPLLALHLHGRLSAQNLRAAATIASAYRQITAGTAVRIADHTRAGTASPAGSLEVISARQQDLQRRYALWRASASKIPLSGASTLADLVLSAVIDASGPRQLADRYRLRNARVVPLLRDGLDLWDNGAPDTA